MKRVLIVDDYTDNRTLLSVLLQSDGFAVDEAVNGHDALRQARKVVPDLVISDLLMPGMDGYTLLHEWKADETLRGIPFIIYTATYTGPNDEKLALDLGADAFIVKPAKPELFMQRIHAALDTVSHGEPPPRRQAVGEEAALKLYNEVLVRKLEQKCAQLEQRIAELTESEERIKRLNRLFAALIETNHAIVHVPERDTLLESVCRIAVERGGFALTWIGMLDAVSGEVVPVAWYGVDREWFARVRRVDAGGTRHTPVEIAVGEERVYRCNDLETDAALTPIREHLRQAGLNAAASCPLHSGGQLVGALTLFAGEKHYFDDTLMDLVIEMAADVSFALENYQKESQRKQSEMEIRRLNAELENRVLARTAELAAANMDLEAFAYSVSHDLRAPLRGIDGFSRILREEYGDKLDDAGRHYLDRVRHAADRMGALIDDLLMLSNVGQQSMHRASVDLSQIATEILDELVLAAPQRKIETHIAAGCTAMGDARLLRVLLQNLLSNAVKYSGKEAHARIEFGSEPADGAPAFFVRDNGAGFDATQAGRLFLPFQRLHRADEFEGSGIGLATVARVVRRHGGKIWAESAPGQGATFRFTLGG